MRKIIILLFILIGCSNHLEKNNELGDNYFYGRGGVTQNYKKAKELYEKAAEEGHDYARYMLGEMYYYGKGTQKDYLKAKELFTEICNHDDDLFPKACLIIIGKDCAKKS